MDTSIIDIIITQGGMLGLAIFAFLMLNRVWAQYVEAERRSSNERADERGQLWEMTRGALERNTEAFTRQAETLKRLLDVLGHE